MSLRECTQTAGGKDQINILHLNSLPHVLKEERSIQTQRGARKEGRLKVKRGVSEKQYHQERFCEKKDENSDEYESNQRKEVKLSWLEERCEGKAKWEREGRHECGRMREIKKVLEMTSLCNLALQFLPPCTQH